MWLRGTEIEEAVVDHMTPLRGVSLITPLVPAVSH